MMNSQLFAACRIVDMVSCISTAISILLTEPQRTMWTT